MTTHPPHGQLTLLTTTGALRAWWAVGMVVAAGVIVAGLSIAYTVNQQREADRRWCSLLVTLDIPSPRSPTPRGREIQDRIHELSIQLGCVGK